MMIALRSTDDVRKFAEELAPFDGEYDLISGKYVVDAKSVLGIYSLNLSKPLEIIIRGDNVEALEVIKRYSVE